MVALSKEMTLGTLYLDALNVNKALVQEGHAWSSRYKYDRSPYVADERMASLEPWPQPGGVAASAYRCDGRTYCSQMQSCAEATYFLKHCPGVKMDGNRDGVPCEKQWCR